MKLVILLFLTSATLVLAKPHQAKREFPLGAWEQHVRGLLHNGEKVERTEQEDHDWKEDLSKWWSKTKGEAQDKWGDIKDKLKDVFQREKMEASTKKERARDWEDDWESIKEAAKETAAAIVKSAKEKWESIKAKIMKWLEKDDKLTDAEKEEIRDMMFKVEEVMANKRKLSKKEDIAVKDVDDRDWEEDWASIKDLAKEMIKGVVESAKAKWEFVKSKIMEWLNQDESLTEEEKEAVKQVVAKIDELLQGQRKGGSSKEDADVEDRDWEEDWASIKDMAKGMIADLIKEAKEKWAFVKSKIMEWMGKDESLSDAEKEDIKEVLSKVDNIMKQRARRNQGA